MYSRSKALQQHRRERRERQRREQVQLNSLVSKCLRVMGMSRFDMSFENMSFTQFIRMPLDQYKVYGDEFVSLYAQLLDRIEALCASAFSMLDDLRPPGTLRSDEPEQNSLSVRQTCPTWPTTALTYLLIMILQRSIPMLVTPGTRTSSLRSDVETYLMCPYMIMVSCSKSAHIRWASAIVIKPRLSNPGHGVVSPTGCLSVTLLCFITCNMCKIKPSDSVHPARL